MQKELLKYFDLFIVVKNESFDEQSINLIEFNHSHQKNGCLITLKLIEKNTKKDGFLEDYFTEAILSGFVNFNRIRIQSPWLPYYVDPQIEMNFRTIDLKNKKQTSWNRCFKRSAMQFVSDVLECHFKETPIGIQDSIEVKIPKQSIYTFAFSLVKSLRQSEDELNSSNTSKLYHFFNV